MHKSMLPIILFLLPGIAQAVPQGCAELAADRYGKDLWIVEAGQAPRRVFSMERPVDAGSWSPDGRLIAFDAPPSTYASPLEVIIAEATGRILVRFKVDEGYSKGGLRLIDGVEWHGPRTLVTRGGAGPNGGYVDVWRLSENYSAAEKVRRTAILGGSCAVSPSTRYVACAGWDMIMIYDSLSPTEGIVDDQRVFASPPSPDERIEGNMAWNSAGTVLYAVRPLSGKRVLTSIEQNPAATEGWSINDRELAGIASPVVSLEVDAHGALLLSDDRQVAYRVEGGPASTRSDAVARVISAAELRRPRTVEIASDRGKLQLNVLDTHCQGRAAQQ